MKGVGGSGGQQGGKSGGMGQAAGGNPIQKFDKNGDGENFDGGSASADEGQFFPA